ncbi:MAG TPA: MraY family glycosyltransferase [Prolixibacteraceae bacterium]|nr:MraY family glycosyltransferase [Prolixibacteraceae bacterium]
MDNLFYFILVAVIAFAFTAISIPQIVRIARVKDLLDKPDSRRAAKNIVPTLGGIAIFIGLTLGITLGGDGFPFFDLKFIFASLLVTFFAGIKDDLVGISPIAKITALTFSIVILTFFAKLRITHMYGMFGIDEIGILPSTLLTFFLGIVVINSINLIDGIDGLAAAITIEISTVLGIWFSLIGLPEYALMSFSLAGSCLAFFIFNVFAHNNKIFMGDTGSLILGTMLFVLAVKFNEFNHTYTGDFAIKSVPAVLFGFFAYPLFDVMRVFVLRVFVLRRSPFMADKNHIHHRLLALGLSHLQATVAIFLTNALFIVAALILQLHLGVLAIAGILFFAALLLATTLEIVTLVRKKIKPGDQHQTLLLPQLIVHALQ